MPQRGRARSKGRGLRAAFLPARICTRALENPPRSFLRSCAAALGSGDGGHAPMSPAYTAVRLQSALGGDKLRDVDRHDCEYAGWIMEWKRGRLEGASFDGGKCA